MLSSDSALYATRALLTACAQRWHAVVHLPILESWGALGLDGVSVRAGTLRFPVGAGGAWVIPRIGVRFPAHALALLDTLEAAGVRALNAGPALARARDKFGALARLAAAGLPVPRTARVKDLAQIDAALDVVGGAPIIVKGVAGSQGRGVFLADTPCAARALVEGLVVLGHEVLVQERLSSGDASEDLDGSEAKGAQSSGDAPRSRVASAAARAARAVGTLASGVAAGGVSCVDDRVLVLGTEVLGAVRRRAPAGEFRTNLRRGARATCAPADAGRDALARRAVSTLGLDFAGVDLWPAPQGWRILEVNPCPGWETLERLHGIDVAARICEHLERLAAPGTRSEEEAAVDS